MKPLTMEYLENCFKRALELKQKFVAVVIRMEGFPEDEIIINKSDNIKSKFEYYMKTYDGNLNHKFAKGISIVGFTFGDSFEQIENDLIQ